MPYGNSIRARALACLAAIAWAFWFAPVPGHAADTPAKAGADATATSKAPDASSSPEAAPQTPASGSATATAKPRKGHHGAEIRVDSDGDIDIGSEFESNPAFVLAIVATIMGTIFLCPVLVVIAIIWYKLRKTKMNNEAMLKMAERGVMPPPDIAGAPVSAASTAAAASAAPATQAASPLYQQAIAAGKRAVWSDLRKGVLMVMVGLALSFYSMTDSGSPNWVGLVLLFVGIGYIAIWWLEGRHLDRRAPGGADDRSAN